MITSDHRAYEILSRLGKNPVGAELGVFRGSLSRRLLTRKDLHLTMVDSWGVYRPGYAESGDLFATRIAEEHESARRSAEEVTEFASDRRAIIGKDTIAAADDVAEQCLDFVFVDADHSYEGCKADIEEWVWKLRPGGLLCGHDYAHPDYPLWGVKRAVDEFAEAHDYGVELGADYTWFIRLPGPLPVASDTYDQIVFACVFWRGPETVYGPEYVNILADMVARNMDRPYRFICLTNDPAGLAEEVETFQLPEGLDGWWNKIALFKPDTFPKRSRIVYLDLDVIVTAHLDELADTRGIAADWIQGGYNSSVMTWDEGEHSEIWEKYTPAVASQLHGDQDWIEQCSAWPMLPADWIVSYRLHALEWPPEDARIVAFHGLPKPADIKTGWVPEMWTMQGLSQPSYTSQLNNDIRNIRANCAVNIANPDIPGIEAVDAHGGTLMIAAGGPSLADSVLQLQLDRARLGASLWSLNGAHDFLIGRGIVPDAMVMLDSRPGMVSFVKNSRAEVEYLIATQCDPMVFASLMHDHRNVRKWTGWYWGVDDEKWIGGGATVGQKAICLGYVLGYRKFKLFGYDSSYRDGHDHAYQQTMNENDLTVEVVLRGQKFTAARWMVKQVVEFLGMADVLTRKGCEIDVYGDGLLPLAARIAGEAAAKQRIPA